MNNKDLSDYTKGRLTPSEELLTRQIADEMMQAFKNVAIKYGDITNAPPITSSYTEIRESKLWANSISIFLAQCIFTEELSRLTKDELIRLERGIDKMHKMKKRGK